MARRAAEHYGHIDILVNNARAIIGRDRVRSPSLREEVWQRFLAINTTAVFLVTKFVGAGHDREGARRAHHQHRVRRVEARDARTRRRTPHRSSR